MKYSLCFVAVLVISTFFVVVDAKKKPTNNKFEGDFEFLDEVIEVYLIPISILR